MIICGETIENGVKRKIEIPVKGAEPLEAFVVRGAKPGKTLVLTSGVHGCEYVGVEALRTVFKKLSPEMLSGAVILLPVANPSGFYQGAKQVVPEDGVNLNRAFPGEENGSLAYRIAYAVERYLYPAADFLADLHSGDCNESLHPLVFFPTAGEDEGNREALAAAKALTVPYRVRSTAKNGLYSWAVQKGIPALLLERGGQGRWSREEVDACVQDVEALLRHLGILPGETWEREQTEIVETIYAEAETQGFWYPEVSANMPVFSGHLLGRIENGDGETVQEVRAEFDGIVLYYTTALGVGRGDPLIAYGHP